MSVYANRIAAGVVIAIAAGAAAAQNYPAKAIRIVVPFGAGGTTDILARVIGDRLAERWGQQVVIDNRTGAGGNIAAEIVARAPADGYTLLLGSMGTQSVNVSIYSKLPFDPVKDFAPVSLLVNSANLLLIHPSIPADHASKTSSGSRNSKPTVSAIRRPAAAASTTCRPSSSA